MTCRWHARGTREPVPPAPLRVAPLRARTGTRECPGTQHKHCLPCICAAVCPQFDTSLLVITAGMVAGLSRQRRVGAGSDDFAAYALRRAAQPKTKRARTDGQEAHDVALARDGRLGEAAAAAGAVADGEREGLWVTRMVGHHTLREHVTRQTLQMMTKCPQCVSCPWQLLPRPRQHLHDVQYQPMRRGMICSIWV